MGRDRRLFSDKKLSDVTLSQEHKALEEIERYPGNTLLNATDESLTSYFLDKFRLDAPLLDEINIQVLPQEKQVDLRHEAELYHLWNRSQPVYQVGTEITFIVPFTGGGELFHCCPSAYSSNFPMAIVHGQELHFAYARRTHDPVALKSAFEAELQKVKTSLHTLQGDVAAFNQRLEAAVRGKVAQRRAKLLRDQGVVAALGFPLRQRPDAASTYAVPVARRVPKIAQPATAQFVPEPTLVMQEYENILRIIQNMATALERSPKAFAQLGEEDLRTFFLVMLNGHYEGQATGETFNSQGKTDILIRADNANVFIAECKYWHGEKAFIDTVGQLLGYVTWRDTKTAILVFNRNKDLSQVLASISEAMPKHPNFRQVLDKPNETTFRYILSHPNDAARDVYLAVLAFDVPMPQP